jgi:hypothetical protein
MSAVALGRRTVRQQLVLAVLAICAFLASSAPSSLHGTGIALTLALVLLDVALVAATGGLAFARTRSLDERQAALRDLAHRRGFRLLGLALLSIVIEAYIGALIGFMVHGSGSHVDGGISARLVVAALELLVMMPTLVIAWSAPDGEAGPRRLPLGTLGLASTATLLVWFAAVLWAPAQTAPSSHNFSLSISDTCSHFATGRIVGAQFGATVGMRVEVCWNGRQAYVIGDPTVPLPDGVAGDPNDPFLTACGADNQDDFAIVSTTSCTVTTDAYGTLHYTVIARVSPLPLAVTTREVRMTLVVSRTGAVIERS